MLAWVISLLLLCSSLIVSLERLGALRMMEMNAVRASYEQFTAAEKAVQECADNITALTQSQSNLCFIQPAGKQHWLISSKQKPAIQIGILVDAKTGVVTRLNWRQVFE